MDLLKAIRELQEEKTRLDKVIGTLEEMLAVGAIPRKRSPAKKRSRRGRRSMSSEERKQVSERMARYWAARRAANGSSSQEEGKKTS